MKVLYLNAGNETGGGMFHLLRVLERLHRKYPTQFILGVMEKGELYKRTKEIGIETVHFHSKSKFSPNLLQQLIQFIKSEGITHVHTHGPRANVYVNMIKKQITSRWIVTVHSDPYIDFKNDGLKGLFFTNLHVRAIKNADKVVTVCDAFHPILQNAGVAKKKLTTIRNGIDFQETSPGLAFEQGATREQYGFSQGDFLYLMVGRLERVKGHALALEAMAELLAKGYKDMHILFVGDGSLWDMLHSLARQFQITDHVHFLGQQMNVEPFYDMSDLLLLTSQSESFPYVLLEAARAKRTVIATNVGDVDKLVIGEQVGWLVPPDNVSKLISAMEKAFFMREIGELTTMGEELYVYAVNNYSLENCVRAIYQIYHD